MDCAASAETLESVAATRQFRSTEAAWRRVDELVITFNKDTPNRAFATIPLVPRALCVVGRALPNRGYNIIHEQNDLVKKGAL